MAKEINVQPLPNLLFDSENIQVIDIPNIDVESTIDKEFSKTNVIYVYPVELGNTLVFYKKAKIGSKNIFQLSVSDIISSEVTSKKKMIGEKWFCILKTQLGAITIKTANEEQANALHNLIHQFQQSPEFRKQTKEITFTSDGSTKTLTICPYSSSSQEGEEVVFSNTEYESLSGFLVTNYRVMFQPFYNVNNPDFPEPISLTHGEYEDVIAKNVEKKREEDIVGGVEETPSMWNALSSVTGTTLSYNKSTHHASSTETEGGDIVFMNDGKTVMEWSNMADPNSLVQQIKSAKSHFQTPSAETPSQSGGEDPIKALKLRFVKGEISKEEFEEMKEMIS